MTRHAHVDVLLAAILAVLVVGGAFIFSSAALGELARGTTPISSIFLSHLGLGVGGGIVALFVAMYVPYKRWRPFAPALFVFALLLCAAVFIPHIGLSHGGAKRWLIIAGFSIQPAEALKIATILLAASYFAAKRSLVHTWVYGPGGLVLLLAPVAALLVLQRDTGTLGVICIAVFAMFYAAGARWPHILALGAIGILVVGTLAFTRPYIRERIETMLNPGINPQSSGYQIRQSFIAIGSGGVFGRGFGQSVQKFSYLPEPMGDSIYAVVGEEFGILGALALVAAFLFFGLRGFSVAARAPDVFGALLAVGITTYLVGEAFVNMGSMVGLLPLTGVPLTFISQGGTAMLVALGSAGILLNISRHSG